MLEYIQLPWTPKPFCFKLFFPLCYPWISTSNFSCGECDWSIASTVVLLPLWGTEGHLPDRCSYLEQWVWASEAYRSGSRQICNSHFHETQLRSHEISRAYKAGSRKIAPFPLNAFSYRRSVMNIFIVSVLGHFPKTREESFPLFWKTRHFMPC